MSIEYLRTHTIRAELHLLTGMRIGAGRETVEIGGIDDPVIRHPHTQEPYLPGSSLKGKLRSLLEWALNKIEPDGRVWGSGKQSYPPGDEVLRIFGTTSEQWKEGPARVIVRDAPLKQHWVREIIERGLPLTEDKTEVTIDRIQGKAAGPRTMERVPAGAIFDLEILFRQYAVNADGGKRDGECLNRLLEALKLLEQDALGGSGSRGYGRVRIKNLRVNDKDCQAQFDAIQPIDRHKPQQIVEV